MTIAEATQVPEVEETILVATPYPYSGINSAELMQRMDAATKALEPKECAARGAAWLDTVNKDWYKKVDVERLYLATVDQCICGYTFASYADDGNSGYHYASQKWGRDWDAVIPADLRTPDGDALIGGATYHGFAGGMEVEDAWRMEIAQRYAEFA